MRSPEDSADGCDALQGQHPMSQRTKNESVELLSQLQEPPEAPADTTESEHIGVEVLPTPPEASEAIPGKR